MSISPKAAQKPTRLVPGKTSCEVAVLAPQTSLFDSQDILIPTAIIYCEGHFGKTDGKTANGLVRYSQKYRILSVIDSSLANKDAGEVLDKTKNNIPIFANLEDALHNESTRPDYFIFGVAPSTGLLSDLDKNVILNAMSRQLNIVNGLHEFLNDDVIFVDASKKNNVHILDIRKPKKKEALKTFTGQVHSVTCPIVAILGTDCALGKRTTTTILAQELRKVGLNVVMVATGQTGIVQGERYCVALDAVPSQFCAGELEAVIVDAYTQENPDIILVEGQGALSHPAFSTSSFILRGSCPTAVILQHAPKRLYRVDFPNMAIPTVASEINLIETFSNTHVIGVTLNHEGMSMGETLSYIKTYTHELKLPVTDPLSQPKEQLLQILLSAFPLLEDKIEAKQ